MGRTAPSGTVAMPAAGLRQSLVRFAHGRSATSAVVVNFAVRIALIVVTFGTGIIIARTLAPHGRGEQAALGLWPVLLSGLATFGIPMAVSYRSRRAPEQAGRLLFAALAMVVPAGFLVTLAGIVAMPYLLHDYSAKLVGDARWLMLFAPQVLALYVLRSHLESNAEYTRSILGQLITTIFTLFALIVLRLAGVLTPTTAALCYYLPSAVLTVWLLARLAPRMNVNLRAFTADAAGLLAYGIRSYGTDLINTLSSQLDLAVIVAFLNATDLGLYSVALTLARLLNIVQQSLITVIFPHASGLDAQAAIEVVGRGARFSMVISIALGIGLLITVPLALPLVYGSAFAAAIPVMPYLTAEAILAGLSNILVQAFLVTGRPAVVTFIQGGWLLCALGLLLVLVPRMALSGAAVALLAASCLRIGFVAAAYRIKLGRNLPRLMPDRSDVEYVRAKFARNAASELIAAPIG